MGVDPRTGRSLTGNTAGRVPDRLVPQIRNRLKTARPRKSGEPLLPIYDGTGEVVGYERHMAPERLAQLDQNTHLGEMIGAWAGRQSEEELADGFNELLVDNLRAVWDKGRKEGRQDEFVNIASSQVDDPIFRDAWNVVPAQTKDYIEDVFGEGRFMIRKDMINNAIGYREATVADNWTEQSRLKPEVQKAVVDLTTLILGKNAFKYTVTAEKGLQTAVSVAKNTIVIRSVIVPASNMASNVIQLMTNGVPLRSIVKGMPEKLVEID